MRIVASLAMTVVFGSVSALAQTTTTPLPSPASAPASIESPDDRAWSFSASAYTYIVPDDVNYVQPTFTADRGWLHLEARYNYEAFDTGSAWVGYNFSGGRKLTWTFTPMLGGVFGDISGVAPGYKGSLGWWKLELSSEGERVIDTADSSRSFFYNWTELTVSPVESLRMGVVTQGTRADHAHREIQEGVVVGFNYKKLDLSAYLFDPGKDASTFVFVFALSF